MALNNILASAAGVLQIAGSVSGVPYASAAATILSGIIAASQQFVIHRVSCHCFYVIVNQILNGERSEKI